MDNAGKNLQGIYGNQKFMDQLYRYFEITSDIKFKLQEENTAAINKEIENLREKCALHRVLSVNICLSEINSTQKGSEEWQSYFNYIRWNQKVISAELNSHLLHSFMEKHRETVLACNQLMNYVMKEFCNFTSTDEAIISEYKHVYDMTFCPRRKQPEKVVIQAGKLFVNFINILASRYYFEESADIKFANVEMQYDVIIRELSSIRHEQAVNAVKNVYEGFIMLKEMQNSLRETQKRSLKKALKLAHARATETFLQNAIRMIEEAISMINKRLHEMLRTTIKVGRTIIHPILHPIDTAKNICNCVCHPVESAKALCTWARLHPWKCTGLVIGGVVLGCIGFGSAAILASFAASLINPLFILEMPVSLCFAYVASSVSGVLCVAATKSNELIQEAESDKLAKKKELNSLEKDLNAKGEQIASQSLNEANNEWWNILDGQRLAANRQINVMNKDQLQLALTQHNGYLTGIQAGLRDANQNIQEETAELTTDQQDLVVQQAADIIKRRIAEASGNYIN